MLLRIILFAIIALGSAGFGVLGWIGLHSPGDAPTAQAAALAPPTRAVLVAADQLVAGSLVKPENVAGAEVDAASLAPGYWADTPANRSELVGAMIRHSMTPKEVILAADVMRPGDHGFLAAVLGAGERAVSVGVDAVSGTAGLIWPGDHVDLILTQAIDDPAAAAGRRVAGETVLHAARVIAIDQQLIHGGPSSLSENLNNRTVTLEVSPAEAERVSVAMRLGKLSLVVVAADQPASPDGITPPARTVTWGGDVSTALNQGGAGNGSVMRVFQGSAESKEFHF